MSFTKTISVARVMLSTIAVLAPVVVAAQAKPAAHSKFVLSSPDFCQRMRQHFNPRQLPLTS